jgi:predicted transcriptional regulator with HTH domain
MRLPSKVTPYDASTLSKFPLVLNLLRTADLAPAELFNKTRGKLDGIGEFYEILDSLYALGVVELIMPKGVVHYVG